LKFTASNLPPGLSIDSASGVIAGTPTTIGSYVVALTVSDGSLTDSQTFSWQITAPSPPGTAPQREAAVDLPLADDHAGVTGDFDGDGRLDLATYNSGKWRIWFSGSGARESMLFEYGQAGDVAMPADYDGDRVTDFAVYRPSTGDWHLWLSRSQTVTSLHWGVAGDRPLTVDFDGDGRADLGLIRNGGVDILLSRSNYTSSIAVR
jgi:hypothetical protein